MDNLYKFAMMMVLILAVGCGGGAPAGEDDAMEGGAGMEEEAAAEPIATPRVFFVAPRDGEEISVDIPVAFEFGSENFEISPVPEDFEQPRADMGHYHLGVDVECLAGGTVIEQGTPSWVHFGDGSNTFEISLEPGEHMFALQIGDDEHRTLGGLCETITISLEEGI